ncbi:MAG: urate hydroxylase PuuD, partial [Hydrogenophaga sp.]
NTYFTLPVLFAMLSNHYSFTYAHEHNWLVLIGMMFAGAAIRQFFVMRHGYKLGRNRHPWPYAAVGVVALLGLIVWLRPAPAPVVTVPDTVGYAQVKPIIEQRCAMCHGEALQSKNVRLDSPALLGQHAQAVYQQVVVSKLMPINNATGLTEQERALIAQWFRSGAPVD